MEQSSNRFGVTMSIYDTVIWECETPLPDGWHTTELLTRDLGCNIFGGAHKIDKDGNLFISEIIDVKEVPKAHRPYPNAPEKSFLAMAGCIDVQNELRPSNLTGYIDLYCYEHIADEIHRHSYMAKFKDGTLVKIITEEEYQRLIADV
jgi:hypothetical protein